MPRFNHRNRKATTRRRFQTFKNFSSFEPPLLLFIKEAPAQKVSLARRLDRAHYAAVFKRGGLFYLLTSGCSGWSPNPQEVHVSTSMMGAEWFPLGTPVRGSSAPAGMTAKHAAARFFNAQVTFVLPLPPRATRPANLTAGADEGDPSSNPDGCGNTPTPTSAGYCGGGGRGLTLANFSCRSTQPRLDPSFGDVIVWG